jgi:hypothetical protein
MKIGGAVRISDEQLQKFQKKYSVGEKSNTNKFEKKVIKIFSFDDPLWRLDGFGTSISLPDAEN